MTSKGGGTLNTYMCVQVGDVKMIEKLAIRSSSTKLMAPSKYHGMMAPSSPAKKMSLFSSTIIPHVQFFG